MRTDGAAERTAEAAEQVEGAAERTDGLASHCSRRAVLRSGGAIAGVGVFGSGVASGAEDDGTPDARLRIAATEPYLADARSIADALGAHAGLDVAVERAAPGAEVPEGVDVLVTGRPVDERGEDAEPAVAVAVSGLAALDGAWHEPMDRAAAAECWRADEAVETWSEADAQAAAAAGGDSSNALAGSALADGAASDAGAATDATTLVRGTRSAQYARGEGGEAYYEVASDELQALPDDPDVVGDGSTAVARLAFVHAPESPGSATSPDDGVAAVLDELDASAPATTAVGAQYVDPAVSED